MLTQFQNGMYVLAISGGPDSMALLHMAKRAKCSMVVCHVNYHRRENSDIDESIVRYFCEQAQIPFYHTDAPAIEGGNFQANARNFRYAFFQEIYQKVGADGLLTAHHLDDFLETALMRKHQFRAMDYYGIKEETNLLSMKVFRPLLGYTKQELLDYCQNHGIPYAVDESNQSITYTRNRIRHIELGGHSKSEKVALKKAIDLENKTMRLEQMACDALLNQLQLIERMPLAFLYDQADPLLMLRRWLVRLHSDAHAMTNKQLKALWEFCQLNCGQKEMTLFKEFLVCKEYDVLVFRKQQEVESFSMLLHEFQEMDTPWFKVELSGNIRNGMTICEKDFPLTIRSPLPGDSIQFTFGHKKLSRYFIDRKIPSFERKQWPVVLNSSGEIIFVCGLGSNMKYFSNTPNLFVVK